MASVNASASVDATDALFGRPTLEDLHGDNHYANLARKIWANKKKPPKVQPKVVKEEIWDQLEKDEFALGKLLLLEQLQLLEGYLWPGFGENASNWHVLLTAMMVGAKKRENLPSWELLGDKPAEFSILFRRVLSMTIDPSLPLPIRSHLLAFVIGAFQSLDNGLVRKGCVPLVSISIWHNLHDETVREQKFEHNPLAKKSWRAATKRYDAGDDEIKSKLRFERSWLYTLLLDFFNKIYDTTKLKSEDNLLYCERVMELLTDLQSQLPTRRYVNSLLQDLNILMVVQLSPLHQNPGNGLFQDMFSLLRHYTHFPIDDQSGQQYSTEEYHRNHDTKLANLQRIALKRLNQKLEVLALANVRALSQRAEVQPELEKLSDDELGELCAQLHLRTDYPATCHVVRDRTFILEVILATLTRRPTFQETIKRMTILPTEHSLYDASFNRNAEYNGSRPLAIPKLNLQYLTMGDFLWRSFILHRCESFYEIRSHIEDTVKRMQPHPAGVTTKFEGFSRLALPIAKPAILETASAKVGDVQPALVRSEVILDVQHLNYNARREWETLRQDDVVYLVGVHAGNDPLALSNGTSHSLQATKLGIKYIRCAEVMQVQDEKGRPLREQSANQTDGFERRVRQRRLILRLDPVAYQEDIDRSASGKPDVYESINLLIRRRARENNFKPVLESIKRLTLSDVPAPSWLKEVFLGYGDPAGASYKQLPNKLKSIDYRDTFLDWTHLIESLAGKAIEPNEEAQSSFGPPYVLETTATKVQDDGPPPSKKRRRNQEDVPKPTAMETVQVSTYKPPNTGPYPTDAPKLNTIRFTPTQIDAITSGTQPGLTVIVGPPGTGKTDVATQIINNIYHNFPSQRTLLIAHSNQALNQLFQKIVALDIDERHLLRLGHGEEELETEASYSKHGRVESFLEIGGRFLAEVDRLAKSIGAPGAHGNSCETADYFNLVYVKPLWKQYWDVVATGTQDAQQIISAFPFHAYFSNLSVPLFPQDPSRDEVVEIVSGCYRHIEKIFSELEDIRPFEILRSARDKENYLLIKEARIVAMTSTHAAIRRQAIAGLGFHYDNVIMEEAAQITEIENFIPFALQNPSDAKSSSSFSKEKDMPLQRIVLVGDHLQNNPIIQSSAFSQYANLEQSLFLRLIRLGVPNIMLDAQGRARASIAELYKWRYPTLQNLPNVLSQPEFLIANAGLRYEYQFIDVQDYKEKGESQPSPHFIQNLGEAEYAVALFMYMRLLGYPASKISILAAYAGQRALIRDVLSHRCKGNRLFGMPKTVSTVDRYQGEQNDYIILSLTRTTRPGYLRSLRRLTVALSRARLGLYILGRRAVFEAVPELHAAFDLLFQRPDSLRIVTDELFPTPRLLDGDVGEGIEMTGVEHLGQYVFEMTKAKVEAIKKGEGALPAPDQAGAGASAAGYEEEDDSAGLVGDSERFEQELDEEQAATL
ncbi:MAG: hypothetical protein M1820_005660 [Bogoriella megaspora]|nr:MAG: hypothetical protein M1820_005660 [Bogoriella megaspora]